MSATAEIPADVVAAAERHYLRHRRPLLFRPRSKSDWGLLALPGDSGYLLMLDLESCPLVGAMAPSEGTVEERADALMAKLAHEVVGVLDGMPNSFVASGRRIGGFETVHGVVRVDGPVALTCLSWMLREQRTGFYLALSRAGP